MKMDYWLEFDELAKSIYMISETHDTVSTTQMTALYKNINIYYIRAVGELLRTTIEIHL